MAANKDAGNPAGVILPIIGIAAWVALTIWLPARCMAPETPTTSRATCLARGEGFYRSVDMWPILGDGRMAQPVVQERCGRDTTAFDAGYD